MKYVETIKIEDGNVRNFDYHQRRAYATSGIALPRISVPNEFQQGIVKCRIVYDKEVSTIEFSHYTFPTIQSLQIVEAAHHFYEKKYTDRSSINELFSKRGECDDILIAIDGLITDTSFCNVVFVNDEGLFTPESPLLLGTKRAFLLDQNIIQLRKIKVEDLSLYNEVKLINAFIDLDYPDVKISIDNIHFGG